MLQEQLFKREQGFLKRRKALELRYMQNVAQTFDFSGTSFERLPTSAGVNCIDFEDTESR